MENLRKNIEYYIMTARGGLFGDVVDIEVMVLKLKFVDDMMCHHQQR